LASAAAFIAGGSLPLVGVSLAPGGFLKHTTILVTVSSLLLTGGLAAHTGGASVPRGALRLVFWGALAMLATELVGRLFNAPAGLH
jgi:VIT1/CCC1 family predicted Fe2+/Mn2+ transporter